MGLDMYLNGERYIGAFDQTGGKFEAKPLPCLESETYRLAYWRKHPNLHGYIVQAFAEGKDECQEIALEREDIAKILQAIKGETLPDTKGFFFGSSDGTEKDDDIDIFQNALIWLDGETDPHVSRSIHYRASW